MQLTVGPAAHWRRRRGTNYDVAARGDEDAVVDEKHVSITACINKATNEVIYIWDRASIPTKSRYKVRDVISKLWALIDPIRKRPSTQFEATNAKKTDDEILAHILQHRAAKILRRQTFS